MMTSTLEQIRKHSPHVIEKFLEAWSAGDADKVIELFAEDAEFSASVGPEPGRTLRGRPQIAPAVRQMLVAGAGSQFSITAVIPTDDGAVVTWTQSGTTVHGQSLNIKGIDIFKVSDGLVVLKDAYRKVTQ